jgi:hypothetical protein
MQTNKLGPLEGGEINMKSNTRESWSRSDKIGLCSLIASVIAIVLWMAPTIYLGD